MLQKEIKVTYVPKLTEVIAITVAFIFGYLSAGLPTAVSAALLSYTEQRYKPFYDSFADIFSVTIIVSAAEIVCIYFLLPTSIYPGVMSRVLAAATLGHLVKFTIDRAKRISRVAS